MLEIMLPSRCVSTAGCRGGSGQVRRNCQRSRQSHRTLLQHDLRASSRRRPRGGVSIAKGDSARVGPAGEETIVRSLKRA
jgi:hypothetical protein